MSIKSGNSSLHEIGASPSADSGYVDSGNGGGNSGCVISPAPGLGLSAYQSPDQPVRATLPRRQGGS